MDKLSSSVALLLVVDVQNDFCHAEGTMGRRERDLSAIGDMVTNLRTLLDAARRSRVPVVWIKTTHDDTTDSPVWLARHSNALRVAPPRESNCQTGTWGTEFYEVAPQEGEPIVEKHRYSAFAGTSLNWVLRSLERSSLLITGVATETCVESTLRDGLFHDYHVSLIEDCCASYSPDGHAATVRNVRNNFGLVASSHDIIHQWKVEGS